MRKRCPDCGPQELSQFNKNSRKEDGLDALCRVCWNKRYRPNRKARIAITPEERCCIEGCTNRIANKVSGTCAKHYEQYYRKSRVPKYLPLDEPTDGAIWEPSNNGNILADCFYER